MTPATLSTAEVSGGFDVVLGNPPFLNQLETATAANKGAASILRLITDDIIRGYTDLSATFFLMSTSLAASKGRVALVQPQSLLAVKDAAPVRAAVLKRGALTSLWVSNEHVFEGAAVFTCAPTITLDGPRSGPIHRFATSRFEALPPMDLDNDALAKEETWAHLAAAASGIPEITINTAGTLADIADATADFRDQYYGLDGLLIEDHDLTDEQRADRQAFPPIVTTGLIDLAECKWGTAPTRILKTKWFAPRIDRTRMNAEGTLGPWLTARLVPKILLATQTRVIEVFVDPEGQFIPSIPLITITPKDSDKLWHVAAALASPVCSAIAMQKYAGAAMSAGAIKLSAKQVLQLPTPTSSQPWDRATDMLRECHSDTGVNKARLLEFGEAACQAYELSESMSTDLLSWWSERLGSRLVEVDG